MSNVEHYALGLRTGVRQGGVRLVDRLDRAQPGPGLEREHLLARAGDLSEAMLMLWRNLR